jgi:predicted acetyltransferase
MFEQQVSQRRGLGEGLVIRTLETIEDVTRLSDFNARVHSEAERELTRRLIMEHPDTRADQWWLVEDEESLIVSSLCLIPWRLRYGGVELKAGEMGIVGTRPSHRRRGLIRSLVEEFDSMLRDEGYDLSHIQGIPYYYRQFGYEYAVPLIPDIRLDPAAVPDVDKEDRFGVRKADIEDAPALAELYEAMTEKLTLTNARSTEIWRYLLSRPSMGEGETWWLTREERQVGYFRTHRSGFGKGLIVSEVSAMDAEATAATLRALARMTVQAAKPYLKLETDLESEIVGLALDLGAADLSHYAWQIRFVDPQALLGRVAPVLERRLVGTGYSGLSREVLLDLYSDSLTLVFRDGRLVQVGQASPVDRSSPASLSMPPQLLVPLVLGYRGADRLSHTSHDFRPSRPDLPLIRTLFPEVRSFLFTLY